MISRSMSSSPASGSVWTAQSLEPASDSVSPSLSAPLLLCSVSLSVSKINKNIKKRNVDTSQPHEGTGGVEVETENGSEGEEGESMMEHYLGRGCRNQTVEYS